MSTVSHRSDIAEKAMSYQKAWFKQLQENAAKGDLVALVNADTPHEILRAFGISYVVNQWWAAIAASRGGAQRYLDLVAAQGYPRDSEQYNTISLGSVFDPDPTSGSWGGLPRPFLTLSELTGDTSGKVFDVFGLQDGITNFAFESTTEVVMEPQWWDDLPREWERLIGTTRIDLMVDELNVLITFLEERTGEKYDPAKLEEIMRLGNEQAEWNRKTRDLIARTRPLPLSINDAITSVMVPQWHRGTQWAADAARELYEFVEDKVNSGSSVVPNEKARLMWIGRGLWFDLGFYRHFEEEYGAVFVWSMYLAIAADGYARYGDDPLRALASRFIGFHEHLYVPPVSAEWYVHEAKKHGVDGVVHLVSDDPRGSWATTRALREAGIPVIEMYAEPSDSSSYDVDEFRGTVANWLKTEVLPD